MPWIRLEDRFLRHPKVVHVGRDARELWVAAMCWSAAAGQDGFVPIEALRQVAADAGVSGVPKLVARLLTFPKPYEIGLFEEAPGGYLVHDYLDFNPSAAELQDRRAKRAAAGQRGGVRSGDARRGQSAANREATDEACASANGQQKRTPVPHVPKPHEASTQTVHSLQEETARAPDAPIERARALAVPKPGETPEALARRHVLAGWLTEAFHGSSPPNKAERERIEQAAGLFYESRVPVDELERLVATARERWSTDAEITPLSVARNVSSLRAVKASTARSNGNRRHLIADPIEEAKAKIAARNGARRGDDRERALA